MRTIFCSVILAALSLTAIGNNWIDITSSTPAPVKVNMVSSTIDRSVVHITMGGFNLHALQTPNGQAFAVEVGNSTPILDAGAPDLPKVTVSLVIPDQAGMSIRVVASSYRDYPDVLVAPSKEIGRAHV